MCSSTPGRVHYGTECNHSYLRHLRHIVKHVNTLFIIYLGCRSPRLRLNHLLAVLGKYLRLFRKKVLIPAWRSLACFVIIDSWLISGSVLLSMICWAWLFLISLHCHYVSWLPICSGWEMDLKVPNALSSCSGIIDRRHIIRCTSAVWVMQW